MAWSRSDDKRLEQALLALGRGERRDNGEPVGLAELYELMGRAIDKLRAHHGVPQPTSTATKGDRHEDE